MGVFKVISPSPAAVGDYSIYLGNRVDKPLTSQMFTTLTTPEYSNSDNSTPTHIKILTLPGTPGVLLYNGFAVTVNQEISITDIDAGLLVYDAPDQNAAINNSFTFTVKTATLDYAVDTGAFTIDSARLIVEENKPPTVGDKALNLLHAGNHSFTQANFTTETLPAYYDPEGDAPKFLYIISLPDSGTLELLGVPVSVGDQIAIVDIPDLKYTADATSAVEHITSFLFTIEDTGSTQQSNKGFVKISIAAQVHTAPTVEGGTLNLAAQSYQFGIADFTKNFADADNDSYYKTKITSLPFIGTLKYLGNNITVGQEITLSNISGLKYHLPVNYTIENSIIYYYDKDPALIVGDYKTQGYLLQSHQTGTMLFENSSGQQVSVQGNIPAVINFNFRTSDDSSMQLYSNERTNSFSGSGNVNVQPAYANTQPTVSDNNINVSRSGVHSLTRNMFLVDYYDVEGHQPYKLKVLTLPTNGVVSLNGVAVTVNQEVLFTDIDVELLTFDPDDNTGVINVTFEFSIIDNG